MGRPHQVTDRIPGTKDDEMSLPTRKNWIRYLVCILSALMVISLLACNKGGRYEDDDDGDDQNPGFSLNGTIGVSDNTTVDLDTNDQGATTVSNDNFGMAQDLPVPVVLGGYVNQSGTGASGNNFESGDPSDFYRFTCTSGQGIFLSFSDDAANEIHLYLYDDQRRLVDASLGSGNTQSLTITAAGTYYLEVFAAEGAGNYVFTVNLAEIATAASGAGLRLSDDFVPGEVVVQLDTGGAATAASLATDLIALGLEADSAMGPQLIRFDVGDGSRNVTLPLGQVAAGFPRDLIRRDRIDPGEPEMLAKWDTLEMVRYLRARSGVRGADPNYRRYALTLSPDDTYIDLQWHYSLINLPNAWEQTTGNADVLVAVIDTGVLLAHPDLQGKLVDGYDFIDDETVANDGDGEDDDPNDPGDSLQRNSSFHGTHVAGTIAALSDNAAGVAGAGWLTRVMPLRVLGVGGGTSSDLIQAIRYAAGLNNTTGNLPAQAADIINLSLGGEQFSDLEQAAVTAARNAGVIIVAAAGNSGDETTHYPAGYEGVVSVAAVDSQAERAPYSSFGDSVDVAAPGGDTGADLDGDGYPDGVLSTCGVESNDAEASVDMVYCFQQGTSMAAPHVSAVAALMKAIDPDMTPDQFDARLISGQLTRDLGDEGRDDLYGHGLIDAYQSVLSAVESAPPTVALFAPAALTFSRMDTELPLTVSRLGEGDLTIDSLVSNADWLRIEAVVDAVDADGFGTYRVLVNRSGLSDGIYLADLDVATSTGTQSIAVRMQVLAETTPGDLANHYVLIIDSSSGEVVGQAEADEDSGAFSLNGVSPGSYYLIAGTDMDNDNYIGDSGEAFGAYLSLDNPVELNIDGNLSELDVVTAFRLALSDTLELKSGSGRFGAMGYPLSKARLKRR
jgi:serine protease